MIFSLLQAVADTAAIAQTEAVQQEMKLSLIELASKGGWLMIVLLILSLLATGESYLWQSSIADLILPSWI